MQYDATVRSSWADIPLEHFMGGSLSVQIVLRISRGVIVHISNLVRLRCVHGKATP